MDWFAGKDLALQQAIDTDDVEKLRAAVKAGANVNARGRVAVTPLEYAIGHFKKATYTELLREHADPNQRDQEGDNAMTLAVRSFGKDPDYLALALKSGGDPNGRRADADPLLMGFLSARNIPGIQLLAGAGADVNVRSRSGAPIIVEAALSQDWDVVWCLLQLGAKFDYSTERYNLQSGFRNAKATPPDSPLYGYKRQCWEFLRTHGVALPAL